MGTSQEKPQGMEEEDEGFTGDLCCFGVAAGDQRGYAEHLKGHCLSLATAITEDTSGNQLRGYNVCMKMATSMWRTRAEVCSAIWNAWWHPTCMGWNDMGCLHLEAESHLTSDEFRGGLTDQRQVSTLGDLNSTLASQLYCLALLPLQREFRCQITCGDLDVGA